MRLLTKDITTVEAPAVIVQGVNCQRRMGSGVAKAIYTKWPKVRERYLSFPLMTLGAVQEISLDSEGITVFNCFTQDYYGYDGKRYANNKAIRECLLQVAKRLEYKGTIYSPKIGCGLGGLDWKTEVLPIYLEIEQKYPEITFVICELEEKSNDCERS